MNKYTLAHANTAYIVMHFNSLLNSTHDMKLFTLEDACYLRRLQTTGESDASLRLRKSYLHFPL